MSTVSSFVKQFVAAVKGDDVKVQAERNYRQAKSGLKSQISSLEGDTINLEIKIEEAVETQKKMRINAGKPITDRDSYVENLIEAENNVKSAKKTHEKHLAKIEFLKAEMEALDKQEEMED